MPRRLKRHGALLALPGLATLIAMGRTGIRIFWATQERAVPRVRAIEMAPVDALLLLCLALTLQAGPAMRYLQDTAEALYTPRAYIEGVLPGR